MAHQLELLDRAATPIDRHLDLAEHAVTQEDLAALPDEEILVGAFLEREQRRADEARVLLKVIQQLLVAVVPMPKHLDRVLAAQLCHHRIELPTQKSGVRTPSGGANLVQAALKVGTDHAGEG